MSALCCSGEILERTELLFEGEDPISAFFQLLEKSAINSGKENFLSWYKILVRALFQNTSEHISLSHICVCINIL